jgi:uncharacterized protein (TIGR00725 family)
MRDIQNSVRICVSGAAEAGHCGFSAHSKARELGREIARKGAVLVTGATTGFPYWSAQGAKELDGFSVGISPASSEAEHRGIYKLPVDNFDIILYTGFGYSGRNLILTRSADAVIVGCGRIGTINEFTIAYDDHKPIGVLEGEWETDEVIRLIVEKGNKPSDLIIYHESPTELVAQVMELAIKQKDRLNRMHRSYDAVEQDVLSMV